MAAAPGARGRRDRAPDLRHRPAAHRHHRPAPAADRGPGPPGPRAVAHRGAAAAPAARDVGGRPGVRRASRPATASTTRSTPSSWGCTTSSADQVEECWQLLRQSMRSISFECLAHVPTYSAWLAGQDWTPAYRRHRRILQLIGLPDAGRRWVLKNPSHLFALDALMAVVPGRARRPDPPRAPDVDRVRVQPRRGVDRRLVDDVHRRHDRPRPARAVGARPRGVHRRPRDVRPGAVHRRRSTRTSSPTRSAPPRTSTRTSACR